MRTILVLAAITSALGSRLRGTPRLPGSGNHARHVADAAVTIRTFQFAPDTLRAKPGTRVVWTNADEIEHTITSGTPESRDGRFSGVVVKRGSTYSAVLEKTGTYRYFCDRHRFMTGIVIINP